MAVRGLGEEMAMFSHEYWVLFQIIHHVAIRYSTSARLSPQSTEIKTNLNQREDVVLNIQMWPLPSHVMCGQLLASLASRVYQIFLTAFLTNFLETSAHATQVAPGLKTSLKAIISVPLREVINDAKLKLNN